MVSPWCCPSNEPTLLLSTGEAFRDLGEKSYLD